MAALPLDDGDQTPASGVAAQKLRNQMEALGKDLNINNMPTEFLTAVAFGYFHRVRECLQASEEERKLLLRQREPLLNNCCLTMCWLGSKRVQPTGFGKLIVNHLEVSLSVRRCVTDPQD